MSEWGPGRSRGTRRDLTLPVTTWTCDDDGMGVFQKGLLVTGLSDTHS